jgi:riboflavin biosynthesis pyrimidine reductase
MDFRQLLPEAGTVEIAELLGHLDLGASTPTDRPHTIANFVASADGRATIGGRSGPLGDDGDSAVFHGLREQVDAIVAGTGTLRVERYGRVLGKLERRQRRARRGRSPEPLAVVITRGGDLPSDIPLFHEPEARILVFSGSEVDLAGARAQVELLLLDPGELTLTTVMRQLRADYQVRSLLCEGGPTLFGALLHEDLVDELFLTVTPKLAGGGHGPALTAGPELAVPAELRLVWLLERKSSLYLRYSLR